MFNIFQVISLVGVFIGSITDIKSLEVPDWLNYSLIALGLGGHLLWSLYDWNHFFIMRSLIGFVFSVVIGLLMFYTGQWGGGDSKMIFGLGALLGLSWPLQWEFYSNFLVNVLFFGAFYGLLWVVAKGVIYRKKVLKLFKKYLKSKKYARIRVISGIATITGLIIVYVVPILDYSLRIVLTGLLVFMYFMNYLFIIVRAIEKVSMIKMIEPEKLTEGDWIVKDIKIDGKKIAGPKDLGIEKNQIKALVDAKKKGIINKVMVKYGIPFVPSFLFALIYTLIYNRIVLFSFL